MTITLHAPDIKVNKTDTIIVGSHDRRILQLFPKMYYYGSSTLTQKRRYR